MKSATHRYPALPRLSIRVSDGVFRPGRPLVLRCRLALLAPLPCAADVGTLTGSVNNRATGNLLEGAKIEGPRLGVVALTDNTGRFVLAELPAGTHEVAATTVVTGFGKHIAAVSKRRAAQTKELTPRVRLTYLFEH